MRRIGAEPVGQPAARVVVLPRLTEDDLEALDGLDRVGTARVGRRRTGQLLPHVEGLGRGGFVPGTPGRAHDARCPGVGGHLRKCAPGRGA